ncbi:DNA mismatch repair protein MutS [Draconibacterium sediminis]|uniref:DNA mismatch repair protein MutS n=1 Tax=Draconibacterium sediminis TaxID=1544798 RepID=A0A0D8J686_9BACT|nr:DNA mismatch repair protein MutS [Draconibacterium sediminis]
MVLNRKKRKREELQRTFGKVKDDSFHFDLIERYFRAKDNSNAFQTLSDKICNDLDFNELFMFVDRTHSKVGQQYLYQTLRTIPQSDHNSDETLIGHFLNDPDFRTSVQLQLEKLKSTDAYYISTLFQEEHQKAPGWFFICKILSVLSLVSVLLIPVSQQIKFFLFGIFIINMMIHFWNKRNLYQYLGSIPQLLRLTKVASELYKDERLTTQNSELGKSLKAISGIKRRLSFFRLEAKMDNDMAALVAGLIELFKILFLIEPLFLFGVLKRLDSMRREMDDVFSFVGKIDVLLSVASLREGAPNYCIPKISAQAKKLQAKNLYHPLVPDCVENDINIDQKSVLLTGSNMSGKTTFIRTVGINVISGLTLNTCFAADFEMPRMRVFSAIRISDDLLNDKSYYFEEVLTIKTMLEAGTQKYPNLFLLDEIFKGTNTIERISAGKAVLSSLAGGENIVLVSTHDIELADLLHDEYALFHFSENVNHKTVDFDYRIKDGKLKTRNAIRILEINDYPESIVKEANSISKELDNNI